VRAPLDHRSIRGRLADQGCAEGCSGAGGDVSRSWCRTLGRQTSDTATRTAALVAARPRPKVSGCAGVRLQGPASAEPSRFRCEDVRLNPRPSRRTWTGRIRRREVDGIGSQIPAVSPQDYSVRHAWTTFRQLRLLDRLAGCKLRPMSARRQEQVGALARLRQTDIRYS